MIKVKSRPASSKRLIVRAACALGILLTLSACYIGPAYGPGYRRHYYWY